MIHFGVILRGDAGGINTVSANLAEPGNEPVFRALRRFHLDSQIGTLVIRGEGCGGKSEEYYKCCHQYK
jgi:hypothetical protein